MPMSVAAARPRITSRDMVVPFRVMFVNPAPVTSPMAPRLQSILAVNHAISTMIAMRGVAVP